MCIICLEFQRTNDLADARRMLAAARREPQSVPPGHLSEVERQLDAAEKAADGSQSP